MEPEGETTKDADPAPAMASAAAAPPPPQASALGKSEAIAPPSAGSSTDATQTQTHPDRNLPAVPVAPAAPEQASGSQTQTQTQTQIQTQTQASMAQAHAEAAPAALLDPAAKDAVVNAPRPPSPSRVATVPATSHPPPIAATIGEPSQRPLPSLPADPPIPIKPRPDPRIELGEAFEDFVHPPTRRRRKKKKAGVGKAKTERPTRGSVKVNLASYTPRIESVPSSLRIGKPRRRGQFGGVRPFPSITAGDGSFIAPPELSDSDESHGGGDGIDVAALWPQDDDGGFEDSLHFFAETHEEEDPVYLKHAAEMQRQGRDAALASLEAEEAREWAKIDGILQERVRQMERTFQAQAGALRASTLRKQQGQREELMAKYRQQDEKDKAKIGEGQNWLEQRQQKEIQDAMAAQQQRATGIPQQQAQQEWVQISQRLHAKHQKEKQNFQQKTMEIKQRTQATFRSQGGQVKAHHAKRLKEMEGKIQEAAKKVKQNQSIEREQHHKQHQERIQRKRECIIKEFSHLQSVPAPEASHTESPPEKAAGEGKVLHSCLDVPAGDATQRQKRRKQVLVSHSFQLQIDIGNEGLYFRVAHNNSVKRGGISEARDSANMRPINTFIPWGVKARDALHAIISGEVPDGFGYDKILYGGSTQPGGGVVKCVITDMRTSEATATVERCIALKQLGVNKMKAELTELKQTATQLAVAATKADEASRRATNEGNELLRKVKEAMKEQTKAHNDYEHVNQKASNYFNPDGSVKPVLTEENQQKLLQAIAKYRGRKQQADAVAREYMEKVKLLKERDTKLKINAKHAAMAAEEAKTSFNVAVDKAQKESSSERASSLSLLSRARGNGDEDIDAIAATRVELVIEALWHTADRRKSQLEKNRHKDWQGIAESMPNIDEDLKKSLWGKMQRRRSNIILRPTRTSVLCDVMTMLSEISTEMKQDPSNSVSLVQANDKIRAEQLLLLALHPEAPSPSLPPIPPTSNGAPTLWAEPGWQICLDVPKRKGGERLLPSTPCSSALVLSSLSDCSSAPGRQVTSMIRRHHLRLLSNPLSAVSQASAPAEAYPLGMPKVPQRNLKMDPLKTTEKEMMGGYKFVHRPPNKVKKATSRKRASAPKTAQDKKSQTAEKRKVPAKVSCPNGGSKGAAKRKAENKEVTSDRVERKTRLEPFAAENMANKTPSLRPAVPQQFVQANVQPRVFSPKVPQTPRDVAIPQPPKAPPQQPQPSPQQPTQPRPLPSQGQIQVPGYQHQIDPQQREQMRRFYAVQQQQQQQQQQRQQQQQQMASANQRFYQQQAQMQGQTPTMQMPYRPQQIPAQQMPPQHMQGIQALQGMQGMQSPQQYRGQPSMPIQARGRTASTAQQRPNMLPGQSMAGMPQLTNNLQHSTTTQASGQQPVRTGAEMSDPLLMLYNKQQSQNQDEQQR